MWMWMLWAGCNQPIAADTATLPAERPVIDIHTHCFEVPCPTEPVEESLQGQLTAAVLSLEHYAIATTLGDPVPDELSGVGQANDDTFALAASSDHIVPFASLECLYANAITEPGWTDTCMRHADALIARGARGFKDHAGKAWDGSGEDIAVWVGGFNRLAGWCPDLGATDSPNADCVRQPTARFPLDQPEWRAMVKGLVEDRQLPLVTHAITWSGADAQCVRNGVLGTCHDHGADALVDFAMWAHAELSDDARRRIVIAHLGFLQKDPDRLLPILDAGISVDLTQTVFTQAGCDLRAFVAQYPNQVVFGTDINIGSACAPRHYDAWMWALLGDGGVTRTFSNTCRNTLNPVGADLDEPVACDGIEVPEGTADKVLYGNAAWMMGL